MRFYLLSLMLFLSFQAFANFERTIQFQGQNGEHLTDTKAIQIFRSEPRDVNTTCYRDVPYQSYECQDVRRYRRECNYVPARQQCRTEYDRVCRNVTRTRQECSTTPTRRVCTERPTREVCSTDANGRRSCTTVGGGQACTDVGGERTCRNVNYQDTECSNVPRQRCETIPGYNHCEDVPYYEQVCGYETRYRSEGYACVQTVMQDIPYQMNFKADIDVRIVTNGIVEEFPIAVSAKAANKYYEKFSLDVKLLKEPKSLVVVRSKKLEASENGNDITLQGSIVLEVIDAKMVTPTFPTKVSGIKMTEAGLLTATLTGAISPTGSVEVEVRNDPAIGGDKRVAMMSADYPSKNVTIVGDKLTVNFKGGMERNLKKNNILKLKMKAPLAVDGTLLNAKKPVLEKFYQVNFKK